MESITVTSDLTVRNVLVMVDGTDGRLATAVAQHANIFTVYFNDSISTEFMTFQRQFIRPVRSNYRSHDEIQDEVSKLSRDYITGHITPSMFDANFAVLITEYAETTAYLAAKSYIEE